MIPNQTKIVYNVTTKVAHAIVQDWLLWMKTHHIPKVLDTGCFINATILKLKDIDEEDGITYAIQYYAAEAKDYETYQTKFADALRQETVDKWGSQFIAFRTIMEVVN